MNTSILHFYMRSGVKISIPDVLDWKVQRSNELGELTSFSVVQSSDTKFKILAIPRLDQIDCLIEEK